MKKKMTDSNPNSVTALPWEYEEGDWPHIGRIKIPQYRVEERKGKSAHSQIYLISCQKTVGDLLFEPGTRLTFKFVTGPAEGWNREKIKDWEERHNKLLEQLAQNPVEALVRLYDFGIATDYPQKRVVAGLVYELVEDALPLSLVARMAQGPQGLVCDPMPASAMAEFVPKLAEALLPMHGQGMAHGSLKPSNILVCSGGSIRLADWDPLGFLALVRQGGKGPEDPSALLWTAPENLADARMPGPAGDVWSLGLILAMLITGSHPFAMLPENTGESMAQGSQMELQGLEGLPSSMAGFIRDCLKTNPKERLPDAKAFLDAFLPAVTNFLEEAARRPESLKPAQGQGQQNSPLPEARHLDGGAEAEPLLNKALETPLQARQDLIEKQNDLPGVPEPSANKQGKEKAPDHEAPEGGDKPLSSHQTGRPFSGLENSFWEHSPLPQSLNPADPAKSYSVITLTIDRTRLPSTPEEKSRGRAYAVELISDADDRLAENSVKSLGFTLFPRPALVGAGPVSLEIGQDKEKYEAILKIRMENSSAAIVESAKVLIKGQDSPVKKAFVTGSGLVKGVGGLLEIKFVLDAKGLESLWASPSDQQNGLPIEALLKVKNRSRPIKVDKLSGGLPWLFGVEFVPVARITEYPGLTKQEKEKKKTLYRHPFEKMPKARRSFVLENRGKGKITFARSDISFLPIDNTKEQALLVKQAIELAPDQEKYELGPGRQREIGYFIDPNVIPVSNAPPYAGSLDFLVSIAVKGRTGKGRNIDMPKAVRRISLICNRLKEGRLLAVDFGTTSSLACAYTDDFGDGYLKKFVVEDTNRPILPTIIGYFHEDYDLEIGEVPKTNYQGGAPNHFGSFKRHLGKAGRTYPISRSGHPTLIYTPQQVICDYIKRLKERIWEKSGYFFDESVFTHPSLFSLQRKKIFRQILNDAGFSAPLLLDEASAGAMEFIKGKSGFMTDYRLLVFDFGGGTTDMTFLEVNTSDPQREKLKILDVGGDPDFGGDDVTKAIMDIALEELARQNMVVPLPERKDPVVIPAAPDELEKIKSSNSQRLQSECEDFKTQKLFAKQEEGSTLVLPLSNISAYNTVSRKLEIAISRDIRFFVGRNPPEDERDAISRSLVEKAVLEKLLALAEKVVDMTHRHERDDAPPTLVLLSGRSSNIPLVKEIFEKCREGQRPYWDETGQKVAFGGAQEGQKPFPRLLCQSVELSQNPKAIVAQGAAYFGFMRGYSIESLNGMGQKTPFGIGIRNPARPDRFKELIAAGKFFADRPLQYNAANDPLHQYAWAETDLTFRFAPTGGLKPKLEIIEHHSMDKALDGRHRNYEALPLLSVKRPKGADDICRGVLRVDVTLDFDVKVHVRFDDSEGWIEAFPA